MDVTTAITHLRTRSQNTYERPAARLNHLQMTVRDRVARSYADSWNTEIAACLCGREEGSVVTELDRYGLPCRSVLCKNCGVLRTSPRLDADSLQQFYETDYRALYGGTRQVTEEFFAQATKNGEAILRLVGGRLRPGARVADVGCGSGGLLLSFRDAGHRVVGCDFGAEYLQRGIRDGLDLRVGGFDVLHDAQPFDLIILSHVLEHIPDIDLFLDGLRKMLRPDGLLYVELPGIRVVGTTYREPLAFFQGAHLWSFDLNGLSLTMAQRGWVLVKGSEHIRALYTPGRQVRRLPSSYEANLRAFARAERWRLLNRVIGRLRDEIRKRMRA